MKESRRRVGKIGGKLRKCDNEPGKLDTEPRKAERTEKGDAESGNAAIEPLKSPPIQEKSTLSWDKSVLS